MATFYSISLLNHGENILFAFVSAPCHIAGADEVVEALEQELGIKMGDTTLI